MHISKQETRNGREKRTDFCVECRKNTEYMLQKKTIMKTIKDKEYPFSITTAVCVECGGEMTLPGLIDKNVREIDEQYRSMEEIVTIDDIERLMKLYKIGKAPLSLTLGFGEVTIARYLAGQIPSKEYSDIICRAMTSPAYMKELLQKNRSKIAPSAYNKAMAAALQLENLFSVSEKMMGAITYVFKRVEEVTPLMLQKLLYFIQGIHMALHGSPVFREDCEAWVHGPVYPEVYDLFRDFKYNPIDDARFAVLSGAKDALTEEEQKTIDLVANTFGMYSGKILERITHKEEPWKMARRGFGEGIPSKEFIPKDSIKSYYEAINKIYPLDTEEGIRRYIQSMIS